MVLNWRGGSYIHPDYVGYVHDVMKLVSQRRSIYSRQNFSSAILSTIKQLPETGSGIWSCVIVWYDSYHAFLHHSVNIRSPQQHSYTSPPAGTSAQVVSTQPLNMSNPVAQTRFAQAAHLKGKNRQKKLSETVYGVFVSGRAPCVTLWTHIRIPCVSWWFLVLFGPPGCCFFGTERGFSGLPNRFVLVPWSCGAHAPAKKQENFSKRNSWRRNFKRVNYVGLRAICEIIWN